MIFNVRWTVVAVIDADNAAEAEARLYGALEAAGFECYSSDENGAFVSDDQDSGADLFHNLGRRS